MIERKTIFSPCRVYRYTLWRESDSLFYDKAGYVCFIGLNPSTADEVKDDPTIRRCMGFTKSWGYKTLCMVNLFAFRATDPAVMMTAADPVGPENDEWVLKCAGEAALVVAGWGVNGNYQGRGNQVRSMIHEMRCLDTTLDGSPKHPLYVPAKQLLRFYS
jgi:hypothetical protein